MNTKLFHQYVYSLKINILNLDDFQTLEIGRQVWYPKLYCKIRYQYITLVMTTNVYFMFSSTEHLKITAKK